MATASFTLQQITGKAPVAAIFAEKAPLLRTLVADIFSIDAHTDTWQESRLSYPVAYASDVYQLLSQQAKLLKELLAFGKPSTKIILIAGSPCQDVTIAGESKGLLGFTGTRSVYMHAVFFVLHALHALGALNRTFLVLENAGSILELHKSYLAKLLGLRPQQMKKIKASDWASVERHRLYCVSSTVTHRPHPQPSPFRSSWSPLPSACTPSAAPRKLMPWLLTRGHSFFGSITRVASAYHHTNLLYYLPAFGGYEGLQELQKTSKLEKKLCELVPPAYREPWLFLQKHSTYVVSHDRRMQLNEAAKSLADLFQAADIFLPFRLPNSQEVLMECELRPHLEQSTIFKEGRIDEKHLLDFIGNYFKPSAIKAAVGYDEPDNTCTLQNFLAHKTRSVPPWKLLPLAKLETEYKQLMQNVTMHPDFRALKFKTLATSCAPDDYAYLLQTSYYDQLKIFPGTSKPLVLPKANPVHSHQDLLALRIATVVRPVPIPRGLDKHNKIYHLLQLGLRPSHAIVANNTHFLPDPGKTLSEFATTHGVNFSARLAEALVASFSCKLTHVNAVLVLSFYHDKPFLLGALGPTDFVYVVLISPQQVKLHYLASTLLPALTEEGDVAARVVRSKLHILQNCTDCNTAVGDFKALHCTEDLVPLESMQALHLTAVCKAQCCKLIAKASVQLADAT